MNVMRFADRPALTMAIIGLSAGVMLACTPPTPQPAGRPQPESAPPAPSAEQARLRAAAAEAKLVGSATLFTPIDHIHWPGPNEYRDATGAPGPGYWQQRADYVIAATLDTGAKTLTGTVTVAYTNNSPDTLRFVWMQLDQNLFRAGSEGSILFPGGSRNYGASAQGGYDLSAVTVDGAPVTPRVVGTMMQLQLPAPLAARGGKATIKISYSFWVPEHGADRMGRDGPLYEIAQWYPRMAVYDDVRGWNTDQYLGQGEFYLEYGDIDYEVTVPTGYTVAGSGVLQNPADVLNETERRRLALAATSSSVVTIITEQEAQAGATTSFPGKKTWRFRAQNVRDVAWAGAPDFRWDATSVHGVLCQAYYEWPKAGREWDQVAENTQWTIRQYSDLLSPYPYPQATAVAGPVSGMEYPMFVMNGYTEPRAPGSVFRTNDHEHGHEWFPMIVGSNERLYPWMDEGINTYINAFSQERRYGANPRSWPPGMDNWASFLGSWAEAVSTGTDLPLMTRPDLLSEQALGNVAYEKPAAVLLALRDHVVGREAMDRAMREYVRRWSFKHPTPGDFFRTVENVSGADLSWFWRGYFYTIEVLDVGIDSVATGRADSENGTGDGGLVASVYLHRYSSLLFPVEVRLKMSDGKTTDVRIPVEIWSRGTEVEAQIPVSGRVVGARLWPDRTAVPDLHPDNDVWGQAPAGMPPGPATTGGLASPFTPP
jgi:hypothetical protein